MRIVTDNQHVRSSKRQRACVSLCVDVFGSENAPEDEDDLYASVYGLEEEYAGGEIYEDLMRTEQQPPLVLQ